MGGHFDEELLAAEQLDGAEAAEADVPLAHQRVRVRRRLRRRTAPAADPRLLLGRHRQHPGDVAAGVVDLEMDMESEFLSAPQADRLIEGI